MKNLIGTEKQIAWATKIREDFYAKAKKDYADIKYSCNAALVNIKGIVITDSPAIAKLSGLGVDGVNTYFAQAQADAKEAITLCDTIEDATWWIENKAN